MSEVNSWRFETVQKGWILLLLIVFSFLPTIAKAQYMDIDYDYEEWQFQATLFSWLPIQTGTVTIGDRTTSADLFFKDLLKGRGWGLNGHVEARMEKLLFIMEGIFVQSFDKDSLDELDSYVTLLEGAFGYNVVSWLDVIVGGRYFKLKAVIREIGVSEVEKRKSWFDPFIGVRARAFVMRPFFVFARGDIGGFGVGSDFAWNLSAGLGFKMANFAVLAGYRIWDVKYETGEGQSLFRYDVQHAGPQAGFTLFF